MASNGECHSTSPLQLCLAFFGEGLGKSSLGVFPQLPKPSWDDPSGEMDLGPSGSTNPPPRGTMSIAG